MIKLNYIIRLNQFLERYAQEQESKLNFEKAAMVRRYMVSFNPYD